MTCPRFVGRVVAAAAFVAGCSSEGSLSNAEFDADAAGADTAEPVDTTSDPTETDEPDTGTVVDPTWWSVDARIVITEGDVDPVASTWTVHLWGPEGEDLPCVYPLAIVDVTAAAPPAIDGGVLVAWWTFDLGAASGGGGCPAWLSSSVNIGFGPYDTRLNPASNAHEWLALDLYGLYTQTAPADPVLVVGVAGTPEQFVGAAQTVMAPPIADGAYDAHTLLLLSLDGTGQSARR